MTKAPVNSVAGVDAEMIEEFLVNVLQRKTFHVYSLGSKDKFFRGYASSSIAKIVAWAEREQAKQRGIYFPVNTPDKRQHKKAKLSELQVVEGNHIDIDPPDVLPGAMTLEEWQEETINLLQASEIVDGGAPIIWISGTGVQALWLWHTPTEVEGDILSVVDDINRRLARHFKGDTTTDASRVLRLPGTVNYPSPSKLAKGRVARPAVLVYGSEATFAPEDFDRLPEAPTKARTHYEPGDEDYTLASYSEGYRPVTTEWLERERPDIADHMDAMPDDRSDVLYFFLNECIRLFIDRDGIDAAGLNGSADIKRNLTELLLDCRHPAVAGHLDDQKEPEWKASREVERTLHHMSDSKVAPSAARQVKTDARVHTAKALRADDAELAGMSVLDAATAFIKWFAHKARKNDLPNTVMTKSEPAVKQIPTAANLRFILHEARITARWNVMKDQVSFKVSSEAGGAIGPSMPLAWFAKATSAAHADSRARSEMDLMLDALTEYGLTNREAVTGLIESLAQERHFHPMEDYCRAVPWDGTRRIQGLAKRLKTDCELAPRYLEIFFRQAVAVVASLDRYLDDGEGEIIDTVSVLNGPQGVGKTRFWNALIPPGFKSRGLALQLGHAKETDSMSAVLSGAIANLDELESTLLRSEHSAFKNFMSARVDQYRVAYGRHPVIKPRMTAFCATSNDLLLYDHTGGRRFNIMRVETVDAEGISLAFLQQCYAEAWHDVMERDCTWWLTPEEEVLRDAYNAEHAAVSGEADAVEAYMNHVGNHHVREWMTATQVCQVLEVKYTAASWSRMRRTLVKLGVQFSKDTEQRGMRLRNVWRFPVLPEKWDAMTLR